METALNITILFLATAGLIQYGERMKKILDRKGTLLVFGCWVVMGLHLSTIAALVATKGQSSDIVRLNEASSDAVVWMFGALVVGNGVEWVSKRMGKKDETPKNEG